MNNAAKKKTANRQDAKSSARKSAAKRRGDKNAINIAEPPFGQAIQTSARRRASFQETLHFTVRTCDLGVVLIASTARGLRAILLGEGPQQLLQDLRQRFEGAHFVDSADSRLALLASQVVELIDRPHATQKFMLDMGGTAFQQQVWRTLRAIPVGETMSYGSLARRLGMPKAARAVARACGANPLAVVVPCHRVVGSDGALSGYRWGVQRKEALLARERLSAR